MRTPAAVEADVSEWVLPGPQQVTGGEPAAPLGPAPAFGALQWQFPALPVHARMARVWLEAWMSDRGLGSETAYRAAVAFSEVVTNAVLHGSGLITVRARIAPGVLECEVGDAAADLPVVYEAGADDEHHRGLSLVDALADDWRVSARPGGGKTVAFTVRADETEDPEAPGLLSP